MWVKSAKKTIPDNTTQRYLPFSQIRDNIIIMKDGSVRVVMKCSAINFLLKSEEEQNSIIVSYQRFLNSLDFPVQILVKSSKLNIKWYIANLNNIALEQKNSLLQKQTYEYIDYLNKLIEFAQIMKKEFYIIVPFDYEENKTVKDTSFAWMFSGFFKAINPWVSKAQIQEELSKFLELKKKVISRSNNVKTALDAIWIKSKNLDKKELIKLLVDSYNPELDIAKSDFDGDTSKYDLADK